MIAAVAILLSVAMVAARLHNRDGPWAVALAWALFVASVALCVLGAVSLATWWRG